MKTTLSILTICFIFALSFPATAPAPDCNDDDPCTTDSVDPNTGACVNTPVVCDDENPCTDDECDPDTGDCVSIDNGSCNEGDCRVTAGGNKDGDINGKIHSWGGQAGAPARTDGNWTHKYLEERSGEKKQNPQNKFTFHSNDIRFIKCSDLGDFCHPARPADYRQIDFTGIGKIMNKRGGFVTDAPVGNLCFTVHLEDMGEPGHGGRSPSASEDCAHLPGTEIEVPYDCTNCTDYYEIKIYKDASIDTDTGECLGEFWWSNGDANADENRGTDYEGFFIDGGNVQMHPDKN